jgi:hypothetical protein
MGQSGSGKIKIKVKTEDGEFDQIKDNSGNDALPVSQQEVDQIIQSPNGFKYVGVILHADYNPTCVYVRKANGQVVKVCR